MEQEILYNILTGRYGEILETHAMWECISALGIKRFKAAWDFYTNRKIEESRKEE